MRIHPLGPVFLGLLLPCLAVAHSLSDEIGVGSSQTNPRNPRTGFIYDRVSGVADASDVVSFRFDLTLTHDAATKPTQGASFGDTGGNIFAGALGLDWMPSEHWPLSFEFDFSPRSTEASDTTVAFDVGTTSANADALLRATSSSVGFWLIAGYETAGDSDFESAVSSSFSLTHFSTTQVVSDVATANGPVDRRQIIAYCTRTAYTGEGCRQIGPALRAESADLNQFRLSASFTETFVANTDLTLGGAYYFYDKDPSQVGYFSIASIGRSVSLGNGVPAAPLRYSIRPDLSHKFGPFSASIWYQYGQYVPGDGYGHSVGLKLQYKISKAVKIWASGTWQNDIDDQGASQISTTLALGARYSF
ncbi:MAG TPA: hypothetical protein VKB87_06590 [Myxococcaceae bacterium]|nr:hypothetical protein [Myxococcaceae bacterium]